jgi:ankyrin repeat protein
MDVADEDSIYQKLASTRHPTTMRRLNNANRFDKTICMFMDWCQQGDVTFAEFFLKDCKANPNQCAIDGRFALGVAAETGQLHVCKMLVEKYGADPYFTNSAGETAVHRLAYHCGGHVDVLEWFAETKGFESLLTAPRKDGWTVGHLAAQYCKDDLIKWLASKDEKYLSVKTPNGLDALQIATNNLLRQQRGTPSYAPHKATFDVLTARTRENSKKALGTWNWKNATKQLFFAIRTQHHFNVDRVERLILDKGVNVNFFNDGRSSPLFNAILRDDVKLLKRFVEEFGADPWMKSECGITAASCAMLSPAPNAPKIIKYFLEMPDLDVRQTVCNDTSMEGFTLAHLAAKRNDIEALMILSNRGADLVAKSTFNFTPLELANLENAADAIRFLKRWPQQKQQTKFDQQDQNTLKRLAAAEAQRQKASEDELKRDKQMSDVLYQDVRRFMLAKYAERQQEIKQKGNDFFVKNDFGNAIELYTKAIAEDPKNLAAAPIFSNRSFSYFNLGKFEEAYRDGKLAIETDPKWAKGYLRCGQAAAKLSKTAEAISLVEKFMELDPNAKSEEVVVKLLNELKEKFTAESETSLD